MRSRTEKELNTKPEQKRPQQCGFFCCNLGLIRFADIVIKTKNTETNINTTIYTIQQEETTIEPEIILDEDDKLAEDISNEQYQIFEVESNTENEYVSANIEKDSTPVKYIVVTEPVLAQKANVFSTVQSSTPEISTMAVTGGNMLVSTAEEKNATSGFLGNTKIKRQKIDNVTFLSSTSGANSTAWDVSADQNGSIMAWYTTNSNGNYQVYIGSTGTIYANTDSSFFFANIGSAETCTTTEAITNINLLNTSNVTNMYAMFHMTGYTSMTSLDLGDNFDTSKVTNMRAMFQYTGYTAMKTIDLGSKFDTGNVTNMYAMFNQTGYKSMTSLSLGSNFDTGKVTEMYAMFKSTGYTAMTSLNLGANFNTSSVTNMSYMFDETGYTALRTLSLGDKFNTSNVTNMRSMFNQTGYKAMTTLNLGSNFDTSKVTDMYSMFKSTGYTAMTNLNLGSKFNTSNVTDMYAMFHETGYTAMTSLNLGSKFNTSKVTNMRAMFQKTGYMSMKSLTLGDNFDTSNVTNMYAMFHMTGYTSLVSLDLGDKFSTAKVTDMYSMFKKTGYTSMTTLELGEAFTKIPSGTLSDEEKTYQAYDDFVADLGKTGCIVYCSEDIYSNEHAFKLNSTSSTTIAYDRGIINPYKKDTTVPIWQSTVSGGTYSSSAKTYSLSLVGVDETELNSTSSTLNSSKVTVKVNGSTVASSNLTFGSATLSSDSKTKTFPLTIKNYTGGTITIAINAGALFERQSILLSSSIPLYINSPATSNSILMLKFL